MALNLNLPDGTPAARTEIGLPTLDLATLDMRIEVIGYDIEGNKMTVVYVPHKLEELREVPVEEIEQVVADYFEANHQ